MNKELYNQHQKEYRLKTGNLATHKYERTVNGFLMRKYRNMESRVTGVQKLKAHLYKNLTLLDRKTFYKWAKESETFRQLFETWVANGYKRKLAPSVDRIDSSKGYELPNMEWVTHSENSRRGSLSQRRYSPTSMET